MMKATQVGRFARRLRHGVLTLALLLALATAASILLPAAPGQGGASLAADGLPQTLAAGIAVISVGLALIGLLELGRMLRLVEADAAFSPRATRHLKNFASLLIAAVLAATIAPGLVRLIRHEGLILSLDSSDALLLLVSILIFLIARLFDAAARYQEDSRSIV